MEINALSSGEFHARNIQGKFGFGPMVIDAVDGRRSFCLSKMVSLLKSSCSTTRENDRKTIIVDSERVFDNRSNEWPHTKCVILKQFLIFDIKTTHCIELKNSTSF